VDRGHGPDRGFCHRGGGDSCRYLRLIPAPVLVVLAVAVGCVGGIYGIGGGSLLAPVLLGSGRKPSEVAPAALASTFVTSVAGVMTFTILALYEHGSVAPDWPLSYYGCELPRIVS
jgi:uncharacterized membrane protein YfcA